MIGWFRKLPHRTIHWLKLQTGQASVRFVNGDVFVGFKCDVCGLVDAEEMIIRGVRAPESADALASVEEIRSLFKKIEYTTCKMR